MEGEIYLVVWGWFVWVVGIELRDSHMLSIHTTHQVIFCPQLPGSLSRTKAAQLRARVYLDCLV